eukprot:gb/GFBE01024929.1/.p1 GENE.gb/GFBE01024929.1/~~gb/GFBE01024929.1/.p1  ORF type:complete len:212 (+),score=66.15 gb/GFBE01024929.1/:1-636(+)
MVARRSNALTTALAGAAMVAAMVNICGEAFVGSPTQGVRGGKVARSVGVDYLLRNGPKDADPPLMNVKSAAGATHEVTFKKRPFGILRYAPGNDGNGAVVREVMQKSRYPGDPQGQAFVAGVQPNWVVKMVNGQDVTGVKFEDLMESLDDEVLDPVAALSLNMKEAGVSADFSGGSRGVDKSYGPVGEGSFKFGGGNKAELPITIQYQEQR